MKIIIESIPHDKQRYETVGDWQFNGGALHIKVSEMDQANYMLLVALHEAIEAILANAAGVTEADVDKFDISYENNRKPDDKSEPGDDIDCPVYRQHQIATGIERLLAAELKVNWKEYEAAIYAL